MNVSLPRSKGTNHQQNAAML